MFFNQHRYSGFINPISMGIDLLVINLFAYNLPINFFNPYTFYTYISVAWLIISFQDGVLRGIQVQ